MSVDIDLKKGEQKMVDAIRMGRADWVAECLAEGVYHSFVAGHSEERPLHLAAQANNPKIMTLLVEAGARIDESDYHGQTPLFHAADHDASDAARWLLDAKANPNHVAHTGRTAIFGAALNGYTQTVETLIAGGANPNFLVGGVTPLFYAVNRSHYETVKALVRGGARVDTRNPQGQTAGEALALKNSDYEPDRLAAQFLNATHLAEVVSSSGTEREIKPMKTLCFRPGSSS